MLKSDLCDYSDVYIVVKQRITDKGDNDAKTRNRKLIVKNNSPFRSQIHNAFIDYEEDLAVVMPVDNLLEYSSSYSMKPFWNYCRN